jgi:tetrahydromethanopterin S-methyltransferase subunit G
MHTIKLERTFEHKNHLCIVFESLDLNLREVLKKFGKNVGISLKVMFSLIIGHKTVCTSAFLQSSSFAEGRDSTR